MSEVEDLKKQLAESELARTRLATHIADMARRFEHELRPHLRDAWMKGHNSGFWNGRKSKDGRYDPAGEARQAVLAAGLAECPYISSPEELEQVAAEFGVPMEEKDG